MFLFKKVILSDILNYMKKVYMGACMDKFKILTYEEEKSLSLEEKRNYYIALKEYLRNKPDNGLAYQIREMLNKTLVRQIIEIGKGYNPSKSIWENIKDFHNYELIITGTENIPHGPVIYVPTHQAFHDHFNVVLGIPNHATILNTDDVTFLFKLLMFVNKIQYVDRNSKKSRFDSKINLMQDLAKGRSIVVFAEATYNCTPSRMHLPLHLGAVDMARKMQTPIVPSVLEYDYNETIPGEIRGCHLHFGTPIYVTYENDLQEKLAELSEAMATIRWELIEEKGMFSRDDITTKEYINSVMARIDGWSKINVNIHAEKKAIKGFGSERYVFEHINEVPWDYFGEFLETEEVRKLKRINQREIK